jgi:hypothetical protein
MREDPVPHGRQRRTSLFGQSGIGAGTTKKARSVVALSRVPRLRAGCAGFASGCRSHEPAVAKALAGLLTRREGGAHEQGRKIAFASLVLRRLLSGCPPTDTRPQARAKLGIRTNNSKRLRVNSAANGSQRSPHERSGTGESQYREPLCGGGWSRILRRACGRF